MNSIQISNPLSALLQNHLNTRCILCRKLKNVLDILCQTVFTAQIAKVIRNASEYHVTLYHVIARHTDVPVFVVCLTFKFFLVQ